MSKIHHFTKGIIKENPLFILILGLCPALAVTTSVENGIGMGLATTFVLICSNLVVSTLKKVIPNQIRIPCFIVVIATFVTVVDMVMKGYFYDLHKSLGLFIPLIVVNCIVLGRSEAFASKNSILDSFIDAIGMGIGFTLGLFLLGFARELLGNGTVFGIKIAAGMKPALIFILPPGAFISLGFLTGLFTRYLVRK
jgi:electron transport complex protein RnfE